jgi:hypothetical protein
MRPNHSPRVAALIGLLSVAVMVAHDGDEQLGQVQFSVSCSDAAQMQFNRAVALLHSFWHAEAVQGFTVVTETDPTCAMGYWGIAMSLWYPLWQPPSDAMLKKGWSAVERAVAVGGKTDREWHYIAAIEEFCEDADKFDHRARTLTYATAMEQLYHRYQTNKRLGSTFAPPPLSPHTCLPTRSRG